MEPVIISYKPTLAQFTLDEVDMVVLKVFLYRPTHLESSKTIPRFTIDSVKYLRLKYQLDLREAKQIIDAIIPQCDTLFKTKIIDNGIDVTDIVHKDELERLRGGVVGCYRSKQ
jgi:hypothetical protein